jgi:hypothetical protein
MAKIPTVKWTEGLVMKTFGISRVYDGFPLLHNWMTVENDLTPTDISMLEYRRRQLERNVNGWNEETLKMKFIAFIIDMAQYDTDKFQGFFEVEMTGILQGNSLKVITDFMVAQYIADLIERPFFYFHEYKPKKKSKDPIAQVLLAMLLAQNKNQDDKPIYGCVVIGELWHFIVLKDEKFAMDKGLTATDEHDLQRILLILRKFKHILFTDLMPS